MSSNSIPTECITDQQSFQLKLLCSLFECTECLVHPEQSYCCVSKELRKHWPKQLPPLLFPLVNDFLLDFIPTSFLTRPLDPSYGLVQFLVVFHHPHYYLLLEVNKNRVFSKLRGLPLNNVIPKVFKTLYEQIDNDDDITISQFLKPDGLTDKINEQSVHHCVLNRV